MRSATLKRPCLVRICAWRHKLGLALGGASLCRKLYDERSNAAREPLSCLITGSARVQMKPRLAKSKSLRSSSETSRRASSRAFIWPASVQRYLSLICLSPLAEGHQFWIERARHFHIARAAEVLFEVALELEHVAEIVSAGKSEAAILLWRHRIEVAIDAEHLGQSRRHFGAAQV